MPFAYEPSPAEGSIRQAEVLAELLEPRVVAVDGESITFVRVSHALVVVMTQDCDLEQDYAIRRPEGAAAPPAEEVERQPNALLGLLVCDAYDATDMEEYMPDGYGTKDRRRVRGNQNERFHCLECAPNVAGASHLPPLLLDFRKQFTIPPGPLYAAVDAGSTSRCGIVPTVFLHDLTHRFYSYQSRVALPSVEEQAAMLPRGDPSSPDA